MAKGNMFVHRRVAACAIAILIVLIGYVSLNTLAREQYPNIAPPTVKVECTYAGADAMTIMNSVVTPLENKINGVEDMTYMVSKANSMGKVEITVYFKQGINPDIAAVNVQNKVSQAQSDLPSEVINLGISVYKQQNSLLRIIGIWSTDGKFDTDFLSNYFDINVRPRLLRTGGIGSAACLGNTYAMRIWMKPDQMAAYNLQPSDIARAVQSQNTVIGTGSLGQDSKNMIQYTMEYKGRLKTVEEFNNIVVRTNEDGQILYLSDVADVELDIENANFASRVNGKPGTLSVIYQTNGSNATKVNADITKLLNKLSKQLPPGVEFVDIQSSDDFLNASISCVVETLIIAILLVILVVFFFLQDFRSTIIPSISIIVSLMGTFGIVKAAGFSMNLLTLFALVLAIGIVVDDAIIVVEAVMAKLENGYKSVSKATTDALSEVTSAVFSCTLVFMAVFIPVTFMPGTSGTFFTQFGITMAASVGISCICALSLCPALCVMLMRPIDENKQEKKNISYYVKTAYETSYKAILGKYMNVMGKFIHMPKTAFILLIASCAVLFYLMSSMTTGLVPQEDQGVILVDASAQAGSTLHDTEGIMQKVMERIDAIPEIAHKAYVCGWGMIGGYGYNRATIMIKLKHWDERKGKEHNINSVMQKIMLSCADIHEMTLIPFQQPQIPGYGSSNCTELILQNLYDEDERIFKGVADTIITQLNKRPEILRAVYTYSDAYPKYIVDVDAAQCERSGVLPSEILSTLGAYCGGSYVGYHNKFGKIYRVKAESAPDYRLDPSSLSNIYARVGGKMTPLSQFVSLKKTAGSAAQEHFNMYQSITCQVSPAPGYADGDVQRAIAEVTNEHLPAGYSYEYSGMSRELAENTEGNTTVIIYGIVLLLIYLILGCLYESWFLPFAVLFSVPFGLMGSYLVSSLCGLDNNIYLQIGVVMLMGLLAKTAILITEFAVAKHKAGKTIQEAALEACKDRLRPILMTVFCMIAGMIPLIIEGGASANGNHSLAIGVVGGMTVGSLALLFVVPAFYMVFQKLHDKFQKPEVIEENEQ